MSLEENGGRSALLQGAIDVMLIGWWHRQILTVFDLESEFDRGRGDFHQLRPRRFERQRQRVG